VVALQRPVKRSICKNRNPKREYKKKKPGLKWISWPFIGPIISPDLFIEWPFWTAHAVLWAWPLQFLQIRLNPKVCNSYFSKHKDVQSLLSDFSVRAPHFRFSLISKQTSIIQEYQVAQLKICCSGLKLDFRDQWIYILNIQLSFKNIRIFFLVELYIKK
jgi:hypothetical protein